MHRAPDIPQERRRHRRYDVRGVRGVLVFPMRLEVLNMSLTGMAVESRAPLEIGRRYDLELRDGDRTIPLNVEVQWCHLVRTEHAEQSDEVSPVYRAGLDFSHVLNDRARELLGFLEHHVEVEVERRMFGRFTLALEDPVGLDVRHEFRIRKLSYSGMLIETDLLPEVGSSFEMEMHPNGRLLHTRGRVVHARRRRHDPGCEAGIEFVRMPPEARQTLERMIGGLLE